MPLVYVGAVGTPRVSDFFDEDDVNFGRPAPGEIQSTPITDPYDDLSFAQARDGAKVANQNAIRARHNARAARQNAEAARAKLAEARRAVKRISEEADAFEVRALTAEKNARHAEKIAEWNPSTIYNRGEV
jgi:hypothetical protein